MSVNYKLNSKDNLTKLLINKDVNSWEELVQFIKKMPYGRNKNRHDLDLVIKEHKGTCSSKHALLKEIANLNAIPHIKLILGIYKMNASNTPKFGSVLSENNIDFIPEAHCYLNINGERWDYTSDNSDFNRLKDDILIEKEIEPYQVVAFKVDYHKAYIKSWISEHKIPYSFEYIWSCREQCIANLSA
ncbi:hypothetical protein [Winogradskyella sp. PG-2]|uniref:hypothetical protein n=1 Tax=Winogradskyella sp. PG-2 TaxID=754409 RepID=UPI0004588B82|nr:hypothetical protein [Winogradskyella sp. PG-2]BAO74457.1 hypothetical protein WPG_0227 [Winogradskyella sp. PG-2]